MFSLKSFDVGILMIGSLYWETNREEWRKARLDWKRQFDVRVPIRYGRKSSTRGNTYTMVFSPSGQMGRAKVVQCKKRVVTSMDIVDEARLLWAAERNVASSQEVSANWGSVALLINPSIEIPRTVADGWASHVSAEGGYGEVGCLPEEAPMIEQGQLRIPWPTRVTGEPIPLAMVLATATNPELGPENPTYPPAAQIAEAWNRDPGKNVRYFWNNRDCGINTSQDEEIIRFLQPRPNL